VGRDRNRVGEKLLKVQKEKEKIRGLEKARVKKRGS
jgi:hypothetical protein